MVLLGWWTGKPMSLLFDLFDVSVLLGACFLVNYVTADKKTNWIEGLIMVSFYTMIVLTAWYYPGQAEVDDMNACLESVALFIAEGGTSAPGKSGE
jgi:Ca2+:H+ antiporter